MCRHPKLTEIDQMTGLEISMKGQKGSVEGMFSWKKYYCKKCKCLITILNAVVEKPEGEQK